MKSFTWEGYPNKLGDFVIASSFFENYYHSTGEKLIDLEHHWVTKFNPYVNTINDTDEKPTEIFKLWGGSPPPGKTIAETLCNKFGIKCVLNSPRLYFNESAKRIPHSICICTTGVSVGTIPQHILIYIKNKYSSYHFFQVGLPDDLDFCGCYNYRSYSLWDQIKIMSECETMIVPDTSWLHLSCAYPRVRKKVLFINRTEQECYDFLPLPSHTSYGWIPNGVEVYNTYGVDLGATRSYKHL